MSLVNNLSLVSLVLVDNKSNNGTRTSNFSNFLKMPQHRNDTFPAGFCSKHGVIFKFINGHKMSIFQLRLLLRTQNISFLLIFKSKVRYWLGQELIFGCDTLVEFLHCQGQIVVTESSLHILRNLIKLFESEMRHVVDTNIGARGRFLFW